MKVDLSDIKLYLDDEVIKNLDVQQVIDLVAKIGSTELDENEKVGYDLLVNEAKNFLSAIYTFETQKEMFKVNTLKYLALRKDPSAVEGTLIKEENFERGILQQEYQLAFRFEKFLDNWRGKKERVGVYVNINSKGVPSSYEIPLTELVDYATKSGDFSISQKRLTKNQTRTSLEENNELFSKTRVELARKAYEGVYNRIEQYYTKAGITDRKTSAGILLFKESTGEWTAVKVLNYGDLGEAYITYLFEKRNNVLNGISAGNAPYHSHELVKAFYYNYIRGVTNMSAIVQEDVVLKNKELAVKSKNSGLPSFQQYIDTALMIVRDSTHQKSLRYTKKEFESALKRRFPQDAKRNLETAINKEIKEELIKEFDK